MNLKINFSALGILGLVFVTNFHTGVGISPSSQSLTLAFSTLVTISDFKLVQAFPPFFNHRNGPPPGPGPSDRSFEESEEDDDENESQARVEPQITPLNRDECLAKLLCGMSVPVTGGGAPKNGYYSQYAQIVAKFFTAFPLEEEDENKSHESLEAYDDYSVEDDRPARINSKNKHIETTKKSSTGLQLFDLALIKTAKTNLNQTDDDERDARNIANRVARARKIIQKLGEKLQTVRQCQQISGCPFTFKQLRKKIKMTPTVNSNVPLGTSINYKPVSRPKPASTELTLGRPKPQQDLPFRDPQKGDDELEEFFGPPPVIINRPSSGFGINQVGQTKRKKPEISQYQYQAQNDPNQNSQYVPYNPPVRYQQASPNQKPGSLFPKKKVGYQIPSFVKNQQSGENDEFDDVNKSTGPVDLIGGEAEAQQIQQQQQQQFAHQFAQQFAHQFQNHQANNNQGNKNNNNKNNNNQNTEAKVNEDDANNNDSNAEYEDEDEYEDDDGEDDSNNDDSNEEEEEEEEEDEVSQENTKDKKKPEKDTQSEEVTTKKPKIKGYKKPSFVQKVQIEEDFEVKKTEDDEQSDPVWNKFAFATSGGLLKEPTEKNKTKLQEKNDQKLNLSSEKDSSETETKKNDDNSDEEEEEDEEDEDARSDKKKTATTKFSYHDDEEFETTKDGYFLSSNNPRAKPKTKYRRGSNKSKSKSSNSKRSKPSKKVTKKPVEETKSESEEQVDPKKTKPMLTQIGGRPLFPEPEKENAQSKKTSPLSRFNFNLIRPYSSSSYQNESPAKLPKIRSSLPISSSSSYAKSPSSSEPNSFKKDITPAKKSESYLPSVSFGASNGGKVGTVEYLGAPNTQSQGGMTGLTFPFSPMSTLKRLFKRPGSSSQFNQDIPGGNHQSNAPHSPFVHRPVGPESNNYKRHSSPSSSKGRSDKKKKNSKSSKGRGKKGSRY